MRNLTVGVFEYLEIISIIDVNKMMKYTEHILTGSALNEYGNVLAECKGSTKKLAGYHWTLGLEKGFYMEQFWGGHN